MSNIDSQKTKAAWDMETTKQFIQACLDQENPQYEKFRNKGLPFKDELTILFKDNMADGKFAWAPSSGMLPSGIEEDGDAYRPYFEEGHVDIEEGSGDSEEGIGANVGVSTEFQHINLSSSQENSSQKSTGKRKRDVVCDTTKKKKNSKALASKQIADAISRIVCASESRSTIVSTFVVPSASIGEVMAEIQKMEAITSDPDFHSRCCQLMMFKPAREMFVSLKGYEQQLLDWLKLAAYNPIPFMQN
ncbi:hypothetical protein PIB30_007654 [Stylosanthes scabra]|uniref:Myb/SANT-like domain-containing protein n=1 Tax=Stylosanthes scabra TaxID=79078 RepID=A0ABU6W7S6_9FABA|nr:hypothetical protein [Stylosanthes scabra]